MESVVSDRPDVIDTDLVTRLRSAAERLRDPLVMALPHEGDDEHFFSAV